MDGVALPEGVEAKYEEFLAKDLGVPANRRPFFRKWLGEYLEFCRVRHLSVGTWEALEVFLEGLRKRGRLGFQVEQARIAVEVYCKNFQVKESLGSVSEGIVAPNSIPTDHSQASMGAGRASDPGFPEDWRMAFAALGKEIKLRHYSVKTFKVYHHWMRAFFRFLGVTPVKALTAGHARAFIENLAVERKVAGSTQNQAFNALLFFYVNVLKVELEGFEKTPRAATRHEIPAVLTRGEVQGMLAELEYPYRLFVQLLYGCGLRLNEALTLRVQDLDLEGGMIRVHNGKGDRSRALPLPKTLVSDLRKHLQSVRALFEADLKVGFAGVFLPEALERKYQGAARSWAWQWVFPGGRLTVSEADGKLRRFHLHETSVQKEIKAAAEAGGFAKRVTAHTFRHSYATHLLQMGYDIRIVQDLLGHKDLETTMIYTHVLQSQAGKVVSPLDV